MQPLVSLSSGERAAATASRTAASDGVSSR